MPAFLGAALKDGSEPNKVDHRLLLVALQLPRSLAQHTPWILVTACQGQCLSGS